MMQLTLGQRIASRRKMIGMSQEVLAERLSVSRQAVSKWESDSTIPEIDKLITLGKIFGVSIGWLLGVESEAEAQSGFSDEQLETIEQLFIRYYPKKKFLWLKSAALILVVIAVIVAAIHYNSQIQALNLSNENASEQISALTSNNDALQEQLTYMKDILNQQSQSQQLITDFLRIHAYTDETGENVTTLLMLRPKVYQENNSAYLQIQNPITGYIETVECPWNEHTKAYYANYTIPVADGYKVSFLLVNEYGYEEENLLLRDPGFELMGTYCNFYIDLNNSHYYKMQRKEPTYRSLTCDNELGIYYYNVPIYTPHIFAETAVAYKDIRICMLQNGKIVWEQSYRDEFYDAAGGVKLNAGNTPVMPNIQFPLPKLNIGDKLELVLTAETANGVGQKTQTYYTLLDYIQIVE